MHVAFTFTINFNKTLNLVTGAMILGSRVKDVDFIHL